MTAKTQIQFLTSKKLKQDLDKHIKELKSDGVRIDRGALLSIIIEIYLTHTAPHILNCESTLDYHLQLQTIVKKI